MAEKELSMWTYECECLAEGCKWKAVFEDRSTWESGAAAKHARIFNHRVKATSIKIIDPSAVREDKQPDHRDRYIGKCRDCGRFIGVGAGRMFYAAVRSHETRTGHAVNISQNPAWKPKKRL